MLLHGMLLAKVAIFSLWFLHCPEALRDNAEEHFGDVCWSLRVGSMAAHKRVLRYRYYGTLVMASMVLLVVDMHAAGSDTAALVY